MTSPLHAHYYADHALQATVEIVENVRVARDTYRVRFTFPELARRVLPGQFMMLRVAGLADPLIGRPLALYDTIDGPDGSPRDVDVVYLKKGKFTSLLATLSAGAKLEVWGPLGNGFPPQETDELIMVVGGIGETPMLALAKEHSGRRTYGSPPRSVRPIKRAILCYGARSAEYFAGLEDFERAGIDLRLSTDDGSRGHHGLVTEVLRQMLAKGGGSRRIVCCGPEPMMEAVAHVAQEAGVPCQVSLETPMACGIGICFSCVARVRVGTGETPEAPNTRTGETPVPPVEWDYKRTCVEGPVFDAEQIVW